MLLWPLMLLLLALVTGAVGFLLAVWVAKLLFVLFCVLFVVALVRRRRRPATVADRMGP